MTIYDELINFHRTTGEFDKALYFCRQALRFAKKKIGRMPEDTVMQRTG